MENFREVTIRAASARTFAQAACLLLRVVSLILLAIFAASCIALGVGYLLGPTLNPATRLLLEGPLFGLTYLVGLLVPAGQESLYLALLRRLPWPERLALRRPATIAR